MRCPSCTSAGLLCALPEACSCIFCHSCRRCSMRSSAAASLQGTTCPEQRGHRSAHTIQGSSAQFAAAASEKGAGNSLQQGAVHTLLHPRYHCWHVGGDGVNATGSGTRGAHFLCLRKPDSTAARCLGRRCCAFLTFSHMRFALASTSAGVAPAHASHVLMHVFTSCSWVPPNGLMKAYLHREAALIML